MSLNDSTSRKSKGETEEAPTSSSTLLRSFYAQSSPFCLPVTALEDRLHPPGISTSSNSSWTFSNSHCDVPKPRKGRLCGIFLIGAVLIVALAVIAIAGLAFYIGGYSSEKNHVSDYQTKDYVGAKRQYSSKLSETVDKTVSRYASKTSTTTTAPISSTGSSQTKSIPEGAILGISETMQQLNKGLKNKKKEEGTTPTTTTTSTTTTEEVTEILYVDSTDLIPEEHGQSVTENIEIVPKSSTKKTSDVSSEPFNTEADYEVVKNGHARPTNEVTIKTSSEPTVIVLPPKRDYSDEPWRPIIPSYRDTIRIRNPYQEEHQDKVFEHRYGPIVETPLEDDSPITFSRESYEQNLRITPEYAGNNDKFQYQNNPNSRISEEIAIKYKNLVKDHKTGNMGINHEVIVTSDDIITAPPRKPADVIIVSEFTTSSTLSARYNTTEDTKIKENVSKNGEYPIGVDQIISGISVIESNVETSTKTVMPTTEVKTTQKSEPDKTTANIKTTLRMETMTTARTVTVAKPLPVKTTPKAETTAYSETSKPTVTSKPEVTVGTTPKTTQAVIATEVTATSQFSSSPVNNTSSSSTTTPTNLQENTTVKNPFLDDSRSSSSSSFNFGIPDLPILKQFHHLDSLLKSFTKSSGESGPPLSKYFVRSEDGNETTVTRFPVRTKQTTVKNYKKDDTIFVEVSTISPESTTKVTKPVTRKPVVIKGEVEVVSGPIKQEPTGPTTELPKLITLLPVRSNVNMMRPLRPRPKSNINSTITITDRRKGKMSSGFINTKDFPANQTKPSASYPQHHFVNDKNGKRWVYYSSSKLDVSQPAKNEKLFIVTPEPKIKVNELLQDDKFFNFPKNLTDVPIYNTIETLLNLDYRNREGNVNNSTLEPEKEKAKSNTSELVEKIVKIVENVAITTGDSTDVIVKVNQTMVNKTTEVVDGKEDAVSVSSSSRNTTEGGISTKTFSSHYKLNQAGVPVLTKILNKAPSYKKEDVDVRISDVTHMEENRSCDTNSVKCGNGTCLPASKKCNQFVDCPDAADEKNCTCAEHLMAQQLHRKLCDGVVDCWDFTDEFNCDWCQEEFLCSNSRMCIKKSQICDGTNNCPFGDDERNCVTVSPSKTEAETFSYHHNGYLMVRKNGQWGKLCIDNFDSVSLKSKTGWKISDLGRSVCKALTFKDFDKVERMISVPNEGRSVGSSEGEKYYELAYNEVSSTQHSPRDAVLSFHETECAKKEVVKVTCTDLECGLRPQATSQRSRKSLFSTRIDELSYNSSRHSRIVGGGNAGPGSWPWQAALYKEGEFQCGGTLISENWLISAGHCFYHNQDAFWVARLGTLRTTLLLPSPYEQLRQISKIILHPQYVDNGFINDISLLRMRDPVRFTDYVRPICLPKPDATIVDGTMCTVVGWGQLSEVGWVFPDTLQEVQLPILSSSECRKRTLFLPLYKITDDMFCAGYERGGRDACLGDSGGPLMCPEADGKWSLFGVTSNGYGCARSNRPGVYTKVSRYLHWIQSQMTLHSETLDPVNEHEETVNLSTSRNFTEDESSHQKTEHVIKLISQRVSNVKLSTDYLKGGDKCKGHRCPLGECLLKSQLCNGHIECSDGSDEKDCW